VKIPFCLQGMPMRIIAQDRLRVIVSNRIKQ